MLSKYFRPTIINDPGSRGENLLQKIVNLSHAGAKKKKSYFQDAPTSSTTTIRRNNLFSPFIEYSTFFFFIISSARHTKKKNTFYFLVFSSCSFKSFLLYSIDLFTSSMSRPMPLGFSTSLHRRESID